MAELPVDKLEADRKDAAAGRLLRPEYKRELASYDSQPLLPEKMTLGQGDVFCDPFSHHVSGDIQAQSNGNGSTFSVRLLSSTDLISSS